MAGGRSGEKQASRSRPGTLGRAGRPGRPTRPPSAPETDAQVWMARIRAPCGMASPPGGSSAGGRVGAGGGALPAGPGGGERCRRGRRGQLGTEAEGFILPREVRARPGCKARVHPMPFQRRQPPVPGSPQPGTAAGVTGSGGRPAAASPGLLRADAHQMPSACCPELLHQRRKAPPSLVTGGLSYGPVPLSGHAHSQSGPTDPQAHHPQGLCAKARGAVGRRGPCWASWRGLRARGSGGVRDQSYLALVEERGAPPGCGHILLGAVLFFMK